MVTDWLFQRFILLVFVGLVARAERLTQATMAVRQSGGGALLPEKCTKFLRKRELSGVRPD
ncbi:hypothetical protein [Alcanivorax sp. DP30]|uniref:hypothetical protein n=1 Tax=Alcanivorax sp. DP30 TaxID=2606217 RepID=UPI001371A4A7|nr:hypothetical protein [Alcanivorax sp. DP30]MZR63743.1 hypothetical protein [Alcanivorax sp. DP30]